MDEVAWPRSYSTEELMSQLDRLHQTARAEDDRWLNLLRNQTLPPPMAPSEDEQDVVVAPERPGRGLVPPAPEQSPFVALPRRTTHGGPWGPAMVRKLTDEALAKDRRW